uniref:Uncharacterized protein n=1 Tax=Mycolicibacterium sp. CBMA 213 TaxID=1968788 RepID=A0A343VRG9_9MYCO|nr:hypothetical protein B5P44_p00198 [Mycolicibacterium sp. CBMA 213]
MIGSLAMSHRVNGVVVSLVFVRVMAAVSWGHIELGVVFHR